jgi:hypothetical protein
VAAALVCREKCLPEAARRERIATGRVRHRDFGSDYAQQPDLTLVETFTELRKRAIKTSLTSLWHFLDRHDITLEKTLQATERQREDVVRV